MRTLFCLLLVCLFALPGQAQDNPLPLFIRIDGDIYSFTDGVPFRETTWAHNHAPIVSPDGRSIAYGSLPELLVELDATGEYPINYDQHPPTNIWIMDIATREFTRIADQPEQIAGESPRFSRRSNPVWSPDSRQIAWLEANFHDEEDGLVIKIYDLETGEIRRGVGGLAGASGDAGFWGMPNDLYWGDALAYDGWSWQLPEPYPREFGPAEFLFVLDEQTIRTQRLIYFPATDEVEQITNWRWVEYQGEWFMALQYTYGWRLWNTRTDELYALDAPPFAETLNGNRVDFSGDAENGQTLTFEDGRTLTLPADTASFAIAPDARAVAFLEQVLTDDHYVGHLMLWEDGEVRELWAGGFDYWLSDMAWSPLRWRVEENPILIADPTPLPLPTISRG